MVQTALGQLAFPGAFSSDATSDRKQIVPRSILIQSTYPTRAIQRLICSNIPSLLLAILSLPKHLALPFQTLMGTWLTSSFAIMENLVYGRFDLYRVISGLWAQLHIASSPEPRPWHLRLEPYRCFLTSDTKHVFSHQRSKFHPSNLGLSDSTRSSMPL